MKIYYNTESITSICKNTCPFVKTEDDSFATRY